LALMTVTENKTIRNSAAITKQRPRVIRLLDKLASSLPAVTETRPNYSRCKAVPKENTLLILAMYSAPRFLYCGRGFKPFQIRQSCCPSGNQSLFEESESKDNVRDQEPPCYFL
jgi:hypothetical protein